MTGGLNGSLVEVGATGGNSPLAEKIIKSNIFIKNFCLFIFINEILFLLRGKPLTVTENVEPPAGVILSFGRPEHEEGNV